MFFGDGYLIQLTLNKIRQCRRRRRKGGVDLRKLVLLENAIAHGWVETRRDSRIQCTVDESQKMEENIQDQSPKNSKNLEDINYRGKKRRCSDVERPDVINPKKRRLE